MKARAVRLSVTGRVQRTGYRRYVLDAAQEQSIVGYVTNEKDGSVSILAQGEQLPLKRFVKRVRGPPQPAKVTGVKEAVVKPNPKLKYFSMRFGSTGEELQEGFGAMQTEFRDYRKEFGGFTGEFRDYRNEFRDYRSEFRDYVGEFRDYREEFRGFASRTDDNFKQLGSKYGEISEKLTRIVDALAEESKKSREMLEAMREESRQGRETLAESLRLLREAVDRLPRPQ